MTREGAKSSDAKADSEDPLGDAIASGPNAVLAFVPTIVPIVVAQPAPIPINIDVPPQGLPAAKLATIRASADMPRVAQPTPQPAAEGPAPATMDMDSHSELPNVVSAPSSAPLPAEKLKAEIGSLPQISSIEFQALPALSSDQQPAPVAPADGLSQHIPDGSQIGVSVLESSSVPNTASSRPRGDTLGAARRVAGDPRRRAEPAIADSLPVGLTQRAAETAQAPLADAMTSVDGKGDTIVEQTLNIARDAAWLDTLAHDIAKTAGGDGNLRFKLEPANLGSLTVAIAHGTEGASIHLTADREKTRDILIDAQPKLIAEARAQGLKVSDTHVDLRHQDQPSNQDASRWTQGNNSQNMASQNGQNRNSSPAHQPFVSNLGGKSDAEHESPSGDSDALYA
ncbi:MAG TPA: flagellar hook-length control protein FliK [Sphingomonas sp.]|nr:flagellar hook-length control protein FliK [Sphingomonas sp.]